MKIAYTNAADGSACIVHGAPKEHIDRTLSEPLTNEQYRALVWSTVPKDAIAPAEIFTVPQDRTFRNAWRHDGKTLSVDMPAARSLLRDRIRVARIPLLANLDIDYQRADEADDAAKKKEIANKKRALRDAPALQSIDDATAPDELKAILATVNSMMTGRL